MCAIFLHLCFPCAGVISIPLYIPHMLFEWDFGKGICVFWLTTDYLLCTASVYNIVLISYDRYLSVSNAVSQNINLSPLEDCVNVHMGPQAKILLSLMFN